MKAETEAECKTGNIILQTGSFKVCIKIGLCFYIWDLFNFIL